MLRDEIVDMVSEKVSKKVAQSLDKAAAKTEAKISKASAKVERHHQQHAEAFERLAAHLDALEVWTRGAGSGRRPRFSREEIAEAAVRIADEEGFEALSMRRLAAELGAGTMTLYHYIRTKDELLTLVNDAVMGEVVVPESELPLPTDWREAITIIAERSRASIERHPWMLDLTDDPQLGPNAVRHFDQTMQAVAPVGGTIPERLDIVTAVDEYVFGFCIHARHDMHPEHDGDDDYTSGLVEYIEGLLETGDYPHLEELTQEHSVAEVLEMAQAHSVDPGRFRRNLDRLLDGIEADVAKGRRRRKA